MGKNKQTVKRLLPIVGMLIISLSLSGCKKPVETDVGAETKGITQAVSEAANSESVTEIKTIEPPEDGWTWEQLNDVFYINGKMANNDITLNFFTSMFDIDNEIMYFENMESISTFMNYNEKYAFGVAFYYNDVKLKAESKVKNLLFSVVQNESEIPDENLVTINGVGLNSTYDKMISKLGIPNEVNDTMNIYIVGESTIALRIEDGIINLISITSL